MRLPPAVHRFAPPALLAAMAALMVLSSLHKPLSYDELDNLAYGHRFLVKGPHAAMEGQRMPILAVNALGCLDVGCRKDAVNATETRLVLVRLPTMVFALLLGLVVYAWTKEAIGPTAGLAALLLYATNPNVLAHGKQVTSDVQTALFSAIAVWTAWRFGRSGRTRDVLLSAAAVALALLSKFTAIVLLPALAVLAAVQAARTGRWKQTVLGAAGYLALVVVLVNAGYLFDGSFQKASDLPWQSRTWQRLGGLSVPVPLPRVFALGLDYSSYLQEHPEVARGRNYVLGQLNRDGRWYAFPLMLLLKTPLAFFVLLGVAAVRRAGIPWLDLLVPSVAVLAFFSLAADPQLGIRYVLPALPFLIVAAGAGADRAPRWAAALLLTWHAGSTLSYHPHYMAYFNELIGRRVNAYRYLADSNLDWEDHAWFIARYQQRHPELRLVVEPSAPQAGHVLVGANQLVGIFDEERYRWLRENFTPVGHVAYSHLLFHVTPEELRKVPPPR
jgi:dolichyl-phosphate-mannose-protein mannosyltransferase